MYTYVYIYVYIYIQTRINMYIYIYIFCHRARVSSYYNWHRFAVCCSVCVYTELESQMYMALKIFMGIFQRLGNLCIYI